MCAAQDTSVIQKSIRFLNTVRHLKLGQITNRVSRHLLSAVPDPTPAPKLRLAAAQIVSPCTHTQSLCGETFCALNVARTVASPGAWNDPAVEKLWLYNLHYFDDLTSANAQARAGALTDFMTRWIVENPPGMGNGWEPYPTSLRIVNWIKWALSGGALTPEALQSLAVQTRFLASSLEFHLLANHLFANCKALVFAGLFFDGPEAARWLARGEAVLARELPEQILSDGAHFELSPTYHATLTEDVLDLINMMGAYVRTDRLDLHAAARRMLAWLAAMTRPDGLPPLFNDSAYGISSSLAQLVSYARRLGLDEPPTPAQGLTWLAASGYARIEAGRAVLFADLGQIGPSYNPGHAHCDLLSFEMTVDSRPVIVNTGTSTYEANVRRAAERGTAAHNTVQIGSAEQSEIWGAFRVGRRARPRHIVVEPNSIAAEHDGFSSLGVIHRRCFTWHDEVIVIDDVCRGRDAGRPATARLHLHPDIDPSVDGQSVDLGAVRIACDGADTVRIENYEYSPRFNARQPAKLVSVTFRGKLSMRITP